VKRPALIIMALMLASCALLWPADPKPAPVITLEQQAEWLQATKELAEAQLAVNAAQGKVNAIQASLAATCQQATLLLKNGRPECAPKPEPAKSSQ